MFSAWYKDSKRSNGLFATSTGKAGMVCDICCRVTQQLKGGSVSTTQDGDITYLCNDCTSFAERVHELLSNAEGSPSNAFTHESTVGDEDGKFEKTFSSIPGVGFIHPFRRANAAVRLAGTHDKLPMFQAVKCVMMGIGVHYTQLMKFDDTKTLAQNICVYKQMQRDKGLRQVEKFLSNGRQLRLFVSKQNGREIGLKYECRQCFKVMDKRKNCSRCKTVYYCSRDCQVAHWPIHKRECVEIGQCD